MNNSEDIVKLVLEECKSLEHILNKNILNEYLKMHKIPEEYSALYLKQEVIADNALFFSKKKQYALHVINEEGVKINKRIIKGISTQRSDYPEFTKKKIVKLLNMIIETDVINFEMITNFIENTRVEMIKLISERHCSIARPSSFAKKEEDYIVEPYQVNAMRLWNKLEYDYFVEGTKGYLFRIKGIDNMCAPEKILNKLNILTTKDKSIVMPYEETILPDYYVIDVPAMIKLGWDSRVTPVLNAIKGKVLKINNDDEIIFGEDSFYE